MESTRSPADGDTRVGAASVHWRRDGHGPAIVFLHGFPLSGHTWDEVVSRLRDRFTCYTPDLIGLGRSHSTAIDDHSSPGQARAIRQALSALGIASYALVGNDTGGWVARELALVDGQRVSHLVLTNTEIPLHRPPWIPLYQLLARVPGFGTVIRQLLRSRTFCRSSMAFGGCFHDPAHLDGEFQRRVVAPLISSRDRVNNLLRFLREMHFARLDEFRQLHGQLAIPTLFIWAANDPTFPEPAARQMATQFPRVAGFHSVANARLFVHEERPEEVARLIARFLA